MRRAVLTSIVCAIVLFGVPIGCGPDFAPYWKINKLRVMAIQADPVVAGHLEPVTLSALVYAPDDREIDYDWSWCPVRLSVDDDYECPVDADDFAALGADEGDGDGGDELPEDLGDDPFDLGDDSEAQFINFFEEEQVREFCEAIQQQFIEEVDDEQMADLLPGGDCEEGYEVSVRLEVTSGDESMLSTKRFRLSAGSDDDNENPRIDDLQVRPADSDDLSVLRDEAGWDIDDDVDRSDQWISMPADEDLRVVEDVSLEVRTVVDPDSLGEYTPSGADEPREEALDYRYFTTSGNYSTSTRLFSPGDNRLETASDVELSLTSGQIEDECQDVTDDGCRVRVWSVVRDARLGVDWIGGRLMVAEGGQ